MKLVIRILLCVLVLLVLVLLGLRGLAALRETESVQQGMPETGRLIETRLGQVHVIETGPETGTPLLLIHGSVGWAEFWGGTLDHLGEAGYRVIAMDLSPMGYSERDPDGDYSRVRQADRIIGLVEAMAVKPILLAHSFGAGPGMEAVMRHQDRFQGAVIVAGAIGLNSHEDPKELPWPLRSSGVRELAVSATVTNPFALKPLLRLFLAKKDAATSERIDLLMQPNSRAGTTAAIADWLPSLLQSPRDAMSTVPENYQTLRVPVNLVWGSLDSTTPIEQAHKLRSLMDGSSLRIIEGLGHIPHIEDPDAFRVSVLSALSGVVQRSGAN